MKKLNYNVTKLKEIEFAVDYKGYSAEQVDDFIDKLIEDYQQLEGELEIDKVLRGKLN